MQIGLEATTKRTALILIILSLLFLGASGQVVSGPISVFSPLPGSQIGGDLLTVVFDSSVALDHQKTNVYFDIVTVPLSVILRTQEQNHHNITVNTAGRLPENQPVTLFLNATDTNNQTYIVPITSVRKVTTTNLQIASPTENAVVFGSNREVRVTINPAVFGTLRLFIQSPQGVDTLLGTRSVTNAQTQHIFTWNPSQFLDGRYVLRAELELPGVQQRITATVSVVIDNQGSDFSFTYPQEGDVISGTIAVSVRFLDSGINRLSFYVDNRGRKKDERIILPSDTSAEFTWNTLSVPDGPHDVIMVARFTSGDELEKKVGVTVNNLNDPPVILNLSRSNFTNIKTGTDVSFDITAKDPDGNTMSLVVDSASNLAEQVVLKSRTQIEEPSGILTTIYTWTVSVTAPDPIPGRYQIELIVRDDASPSGSVTRSINLDVVKDGICNQASDGVCDPDCNDNTWKGAIFRGYDLDCIGGLGAVCEDDASCDEGLFCDDDGCSTNRTNTTGCTGFNTGNLGVCTSCVLETSFDSISPAYCEELCGADAACDERRPGDSCLGGKICSSDCLCNEDPNQLYFTGAVCAQGSCELRYKNTYSRDYKALLFVRSSRGIVVDSALIDIPRGISNVTTNFASCAGKTGLKLGWIVFEKTDSSLDNPLPGPSASSTREVGITC